jgi:hypothetical protein
MKTRATLLITIVMSLGANAALAFTSGIDQRQSNQEARIEQGVRSGELTNRESVRLVRGQVELQKMENRSKRDGVVTNRERARLHKKASGESGRIYRNKHDGSRRSNKLAY